MKNLSDSSSEESDVSENNEEHLANLEIFKNQLKENKLNYEAHVGFIKCLRKLGELDELRNAHKRMNAIYPLSPEIWMDWLGDEQKICTSDEERSYVTSLFEKAVKEYMSVQLWVEYIMFALGGGDMEGTRRVCENALTAVGIHLAEGVLVWQAVLLVEQQFLLSLTPNKEDEIKQQKERICSLIRRQSRVPLMNVERQEFVDEAEKWFNGKIDTYILKDFDASCAKMMKKLPYEEAILQAGDETGKLEAYRKYIDHVRASENPAVIQNIYERTVTDLCLNAGIWEEYIRFVMDQFENADYIVLPVVERAHLNCPWSSAILELRVTAMQMFTKEAAEQTKKDIKDVLKKSLSCELSDETELSRMWMAYLVYLRRQIDWGAENVQTQLQEFRDAVQEALDHILQGCGENGCVELSVARFAARIEAESAKDMEMARSLWNDRVMKTNNNFKRSSLWLEFIQLERSFGDEKHCRKLFRRALERVWDGVEDIGNAFAQFEREMGSLQTMMECQKRYSDRLSIVLKKRQENALRENRKEEMSKGDKQKGKNKQQHETQQHKQQHETNQKQQKEQSPQHKQKGEAGSSLPKEEVQHKQQPTPPKGTKRPISDLDAPPGYVEHKMSQEPMTKRTKDDSKKGHGEYVSHDSSLDPRTAFLSNLDFDALESSILEVFADCGAVDSLRLVRDFKGRSKGFGYLVFDRESSVAAALAKDRTPIGSRPVFVSQCQPKTEMRQKVFKFSENVEREKLFMRGLPQTLDEAGLRSMASEHGEVRAIRIVTHRNGFSKGVAFMDCANAEAAENIRKAMDGSVIEECKIQVMISDPSAPKRQANVFVSRGGPPRSEGGESSSHQRPKLNLMPRALLRKDTSNAPNGSEKKDEAPKSNDDFRKMFTK